MATQQHPSALLLSHLDGTLAPGVAEEVIRHLSGCRDCAEEQAGLMEARRLLAPVQAEPRPGFAARVARQAGGQASNTAGAPWWRWAAGGGLALASLAVLALVVISPHRGADGPSEDMRMAQRLDLYEDMSVLQHEQALEDLEVVEVLHTLRPEARP
ncbi:MAG TPA: zf-HC2 domain-containing protein [Myxococcales bacterium]|jgi:anti-sigma factor RsiW|nr:zf-HC2 domain-containing protein [Myxococcales bacterium]